MSNGERICVKCDATMQTGDACGACGAALTLAGHYEALRETRDALDAKAFEVRDRRTGALSVLVKLPLDPVSPRMAAKLDERLRAWRSADPERSIAPTKLIRVADDGDTVRLYVVRARAPGTALESHTRLENEQAYRMAHTVLRTLASVQRSDPTFRHGAIAAANIIEAEDDFLVGPPSFSPAMLASNPESAHADVAQLADLVRALVTLENGDVAESWKRWIARASGRGESPYRDAKAALTGLATVKDKAKSDPAWRTKRRGDATNTEPSTTPDATPESRDAAPRVESAHAPTPASSNNAPGGVPNAKRKKKQMRKAMAAAHANDVSSGEASQTAPESASEKELAARAFRAGLVLVLGVACLAWEMAAIGR